MRFSSRFSLQRYLAAVALLLSGIVVGVFGSHVWMRTQGVGFPPPPDVFKARIWQHFEKELELTADQIALIQPEFDSAWKRGDEIRRTVEPEIQAIFAETEKRMRVHLTPEQQERLDALRKRMEERRKDFDGPPPPPLFGDAPPPPQ